MSIQVAVYAFKHLFCYGLGAGGYAGIVYFSFKFCTQFLQVLLLRIPSISGPSSTQGSVRASPKPSVDKLPKTSAHDCVLEYSSGHNRCVPQYPGKPYSPACCFTPEQAVWVNQVRSSTHASRVRAFQSLSHTHHMNKNMVVHFLLMAFSLWFADLAFCVCRAGVGHGSW